MFDELLASYRSAQSEKATAFVMGYDGTSVEIGALATHIGALCTIKTIYGSTHFGEVIKICATGNVISMYEDNCPISVGDKVSLSKDSNLVDVGPELLGRVINASGGFLDEKAEPVISDRWPLHGVKTNPATRPKVHIPLDVGIRSINATLSLGRGQRVGIFAGSGVGKSSLISMITEATEADVIVVGLIGERGREVADFVQKNSNSRNFEKTVVIAEPADSSPLLRVKGVQRATAIAEYFRACGKNVLLIVDSLTRVAHAQREIGLSRGEVAVTKGYTPSVFNLIPKLIERTGCTAIAAGSITSIYTVLADGDDLVADPIIDTSRAILDGHIVLSRQYAQQGIYPAIDVTMSVSRIMNDIICEEQLKNASTFKALVSTYFENKDLVLLGGYKQGQNRDLDLALELWPKILDFLKQRPGHISSWSESKKELDRLLS